MYGSIVYGGWPNYEEADTPTTEDAQENDAADDASENSE